MPTEIPHWDQCVITYTLDLKKRDRKAFRFAKRKLTGVTGIVFRKSSDGEVVVRYDDLPANYLGYTNWWGIPIFQAEVRLSKDYTKSATRGDRRHLMMHEFGHVLGLDHNYKNSKHVMYAWHTDKTEWSKQDKRKLRRHSVCEP